MESNKRITVTFLRPDMYRVDFIMKTTTKFGRAMLSFSERLNIDITKLDFRFEGRRVTKDDTPKEINMEDNMVIDCYIKQVASIRPKFIVFRIAGTDAFAVDFRINTSSKIGKAMEAYSKMRNVPLNLLHFRLEGCRVFYDETPKDLNLKQDDCIDCHTYPLF